VAGERARRILGAVDGRRPYRSLSALKSGARSSVVGGAVVGRTGVAGRVVVEGSERRSTAGVVGGTGSVSVGVGCGRTCRSTLPPTCSNIVSVVMQGLSVRVAKQLDMDGKRVGERESNVRRELAGQDIEPPMLTRSSLLAAGCGH
jgi:hypothetical protein